MKAGRQSISVFEELKGSKKFQSKVSENLGSSTKAILFKGIYIEF